MIHAALDEAGVAASDAVMVGDTRFDLDMAEAAGVPFIGVGWGYHPAHSLTGAAHIIEDFAGLVPALQDIWEA